MCARHLWMKGKRFLIYFCVPVRIRTLAVHNLSAHRLLAGRSLTAHTAHRFGHSMWTPSRSLLTYSGRIALAATLGLIVSILIGLHEPHWAAWTVVSVRNAVRGGRLLQA